VPDPEPPVTGSDAAEAPAPAPAAPAPEAPPAEDWETRFKYLLAEFDNFRKRSERERDQAERNGRARVLRAILPLWEAFDRAEAEIQKLPASDPLRHGLQLLRKEFEQFLRAEGVEPVARVGEPFRADDHDAVGESAPSKEARDGRIAEVVQQGYRSALGLLRPAKVVVARRPAPAAVPAPAAASDEARQ